MQEKTCPIKNWAALETAYRALATRQKSRGRMMLVHGEPGLGKTTAVDRIALRHGGVYMVASSTWTQRVLLEKLSERLGLRVRARDRVSDILDGVLSELDRLGDVFLVIDEFDRIAHKVPVVELVREIYDVSDVPVVMVGMGTIEKTLAEIPQFSRRIGERVKFQPLDRGEARNVANALCEVELTDDLVEALRERSSGVISYFVDELDAAEALARREGLKSVGVAELKVA